MPSVSVVSNKEDSQWLQSIAPIGGFLILWRGHLSPLKVPWLGMEASS